MLLIRAAQGEVTVLAPSLALYELNNVFVINGLSSEAIQTAFSLLFDLIATQSLVIMAPTRALLHKAAEIASLGTQGAGHISSYDATFHALAVTHNIPLLTADRKHFEKTRERVGAVRLLAHYV